MKCSLCGQVFNEKAAAPACAKCPCAGSCELVRCPNCGFEMPVEPKWIERLKNTLKGAWTHARQR